MCVAEDDGLVRVELLTELESADLARQELTYSAIGQSVRELPPGYGHLACSRRLPGRTSFAELSQALMSWQVQARSGLRVTASSAQVQHDAVVVMRFGIGPASLRIPCRVVAVFDEVDRRGFAYGTLPGHPESGEEAFALQRHPDGSIDFTITAFSRPETMLSRLGGPVTAHLQRWMTNRYLHALD